VAVAWCQVLPAAEDPAGRSPVGAKDPVIPGVADGEPWRGVEDLVESDPVVGLSGDVGDVAVGDRMRHGGTAPGPGEQGGTASLPRVGGVKFGASGSGADARSGADPDGDRSSPGSVMM
jgi:hypothetical protein